MDFQYAHQLDHTIRLICARAANARRPDSLGAPRADSRSPTILAGVQGAYNAVWVKGQYGEDTFYYGRGAGPQPTGVAVVSDLMRVAREIRSGSPERVSPFAHERLGEYKPVSVTLQKRAYYLRFRVDDRPGIIAALAGILAEKHISLEAVLQEPLRHQARSAVRHHGGADLRAVPCARRWRRCPHLDFLLEPPLALPMEPPL